MTVCGLFTSLVKMLIYISVRHKVYSVFEALTLIIQMYFVTHFQFISACFIFKGPLIQFDSIQFDYKEEPFC